MPKRRPRPVITVVPAEEVSRIRDSRPNTTYVRSPLDHDGASSRSRAYADRAVRDSARLDRSMYPAIRWIDAYMGRYRYYTGRERHAGPYHVRTAPAREPK